MSLNWIGLVAALATFFGVWIGHVTVRRIEFISPTLLLPSLAALSLGLACEIGAVLSQNLYLSTALGILGVTLLWDALEFRRQERRVLKGHAPANPANPRHARILRESPAATTIDWLKREPARRRLSEEELQAVQESGS